MVAKVNRAGVGHIVRPQIAGGKRNAAPLNLKIAGGVLHRTRMAYLGRLLFVYSRTRVLIECR